MANLTISISDELYTRMEYVRDLIDISRVCEKALAKETHRLERKKVPTLPTGLSGGGEGGHGTSGAGGGF